MILLVFFSFGVIGCTGGGGGSTTNSLSVGRATFIIAWSEQSRLIPAAAQSIKISLSGPSSIDRIVPRPAVGTNQTTVTFNDLVPGNYSVTATSFPNTDATGIAQSTGLTSVTVVKDQTSTGTLTMNTTVTKVNITPNIASIAIGGNQSATGNAQDVANATVLTSPSKWTWTTSDSSIATVSSPGNPATVTGIKAGSVVVTGSENESGKSAVLNIVVNPDKGNLDLIIK